MEKERFLEILNLLSGVHERNKDREGDDLSNFRMCEKMGLPAWKGVLAIMVEEMGRLMKAAKSEGAETETSRELLTRLVRHSIIARILVEEPPEDTKPESGPRRGRRAKEEKVNLAEAPRGLTEEASLNQVQELGGAQDGN